jgi:metacaspase-1
MTKGISLHIGLNHVDSTHYEDENGDPWDGALKGCINDAKDMRAIADGLGYQSTILIDEQATSDQVIEHIARAGQDLRSDDIFLLTYSGHGSHIEDVNGDEEDGQDETWVLYDRMLIDDELYSLWSQFEPGVRVFVLSDSCHSGTVTKVAAYEKLYSKTKGSASKDGSPPLFKAMPRSVQMRTYQLHERMYNTLQWAAGRGDRSTLGASILLISGCQDNQLSNDGSENGLFTATLLEVWEEGIASNYEHFWKEIVRRMPFEQSPNYYKVGATNLNFERQKPFTISDGTNGPTTPTAQLSVKGPDSWARDSEEAPSFTVSTGSNRYYIFEAATQPELFDLTNHGLERTSQNFYGTWNDPNVPSRLTATSFTLPQNVWDRLKQAERIYYRIGTTSSLTGWDNYQVSTSESQTHLAPFLTITEEEDSETPATPSAETLRYPSDEEFEVVDPADVDDGVDYSDPTASGVVPLIRIADQRESSLSRNFKVKEFVDDENSNYARISPELVEKLQDMRDQTGAINIRSGYRHPALNADVGGASRSQHVAGRAVEIYSNTLTPLELAEIALDVIGCDIGIGLGPDYIGVDLRGTAATWVEPGADQTGSEFRAWVDQICQRKAVTVVPQRGRAREKLR